MSDAMLLDVIGAVDFPPEALARHLAASFGGPAPLTLERIGGGQSNPTYFVTHAAERMVLRKQPAGPLLRGAHAVDREYRVLEALFPEGLPVPRPILFCADPAPLGTPFYLMGRVDGRVFDDCALPDVAREERAPLWMALADTLATLHRVRPEEVGLGGFGRPHGYFARQLDRWSGQMRASPAGPIAELERLEAWLRAALPDDNGASGIAHGDFRLGNMIFHPREPRVAAVLDWELSTLGHPLADLGFCVIPWNTSSDEFGGLADLDLGRLGIPSKQAFVERYRAGNSTAPELLPFHEAFALFRFAVIFVGIADRARQGNATAANAGTMGPLARRFAIRGLEVASA